MPPTSFSEPRRGDLGRAESPRQKKRFTRSSDRSRSRTGVAAYEAARALTPGRAIEALGDFAAIDMTRYPHEIFLTRIWELRRNASAYDAAYLALAEALGAPLLTSDKRMAGVPGHGASVELVRQ